MKLSVISPTYNEAPNIAPLVEQISQALTGIDHEILVVDDDSPDLTWSRAEDIARDNPSVRVIRRMQNPGLTPAVIEGFTSAQGDVVACIDADLQHDPSILPQMLRELESGCDIVVGSRYANGGGTGNWNRLRRFESWIATQMAKVALGTKAQDPMSGYFLMWRKDFDSVRSELNGAGFKILLEIFAKLRPKQVREVPYTFRLRVAGESKLSAKVVLQYLNQLWRLSRVDRIFSDRFLKFALVGTSGVLVNLISLALLLTTFGLRDWRASALASTVANLSNYLINNIWTFSDRAHRRWQIIRRYPSYLMMSGVGLALSTTTYAGLTWALKGSPLFSTSTNLFARIALLCQLASIAVGTLLNYELSAKLTWPSVDVSLTAEKEPFRSATGETVGSPESAKNSIA